MTQAPPASQLVTEANDLDIAIPVYNEGANIVPVLDALRAKVGTSFRVLIGYDRDDDDTLVALRGYAGVPIEYVRNTGSGVGHAIRALLAATRAPAVLVMPADDSYNAGRVDPMYERIRSGADIVVGSRFIPGGGMHRCPLLKAILVRAAAWTLYHLARLPTHDPSNGFRMFSRRVLDAIPIESSMGWTFSIELVVKCHRLGGVIDEVPVEWHERTKGKSRFRLVSWLPYYLDWYRYAFATTWLLRPASSVTLRPGGRWRANDESV